MQVVGHWIHNPAARAQSPSTAAGLALAFSPLQIRSLTEQGIPVVVLR